MLDLNELTVDSCESEGFKGFLKDYTGDANIKHLIMDFDEWLMKNRNALKAFHINTQPREDFTKWARFKFYAWMFHQYKKTLDGEINNILRTR